MAATKTANRKKQAVRKRTPTAMIRPKVQEVLAQIVKESQLPPRRDIATRAGVSQQTLYTHALDLVEAAEAAWTKEHMLEIKPETKRLDEEEIIRQKNDQIERLKEQLNDVAERMTWMLKAVQQFAPKALPKITEVLLPTYRHDKESNHD